MEIRIDEFIKEDIDRLNILFQKGAKISKKRINNFSYEDYPYLKEYHTIFEKFSLPYFLSYSVLKWTEDRSNQSFTKNIWYWKHETSSNKTIDFLPEQSKLIYDTLDVYVNLLKTGHLFQALVMFRSYIEYSSQFYASILDYDFYQKYANTDLLDEEYKKLWFDSLKPGKVLSKIKSIHAEINLLLKNGEIKYGKDTVYRHLFHPFDSELRGFLYNSLSGLAHGSYSSIVKQNEVKLYSLVWLCTIYLIESQTVIDEIISIYHKLSPEDLFKKWITIEVYLKSREPITIFTSD